MNEIQPGMTAVMFASTRNAADGAGYDAAADAMLRLAERQPGYVAFDSVRGDDARGITVSYWASESDAIAWRDNPDHKCIRDRGRQIWYDDYLVVVATVDRAYSWARTRTDSPLPSSRERVG